jgi:hypothetical protein
MAAEDDGEALFLTLPTHFYRDGRYLLTTHYNDIPSPASRRQFTPELHQLNARLIGVDWSSLGFIAHENDHYCLCFYARGSGVIEHFNTLGRPAPPHVAELLAWILIGVPDEPTTLQMKSIPVLHQGYTRRGSCGVGAYAHAVCAARPSTSIFTGSTSSLWRDTVLRDLLLYYIKHKSLVR